MVYGILKDTILKGQTQWQFAKGAFWKQIYADNTSQPGHWQADLGGQNI